MGPCETSLRARRFHKTSASSAGTAARPISLSPPGPSGMPRRCRCPCNIDRRPKQADPPATHSACVATPISAPTCTPPNARERSRTAGQTGTAAATATRTATRRDLGPRSGEPQNTKAQVRGHFCGAALGNRTPDLRITSASLWPTELRRRAPGPSGANSECTCGPRPVSRYDRPPARCRRPGTPRSWRRCSRFPGCMRCARRRRSSAAPLTPAARPARRPTHTESRGRGRCRRPGSVRPQQRAVRQERDLEHRPARTRS